MTFMKPIQKLIISKVKTLVEKQQLAESIEHRTTKGNLREIFLREFIIDLIPDEYDTTTGFIASSKQEYLSPQIDLIINEKTRTPKFLLSETNSIIPFESVFLLIEVKTRITNAISEQIGKQNEFIKNCGNPVFFRTDLLTDLGIIESKIGESFKCTNNIFNYPPQFIAAFSSDLNDDNLKELFYKVERLMGIWILGKFFLYPTEEKKLEKIEGDQSSLFAVNRILESITNMNQERQFYRMNWTKYFK